MVMIPNEELYLQAAQSIEVHTLVEIQLQTFFFFHTRPLIQFHDRGTLTEIHTKLKSLKKWFTSQHCCTWTKQIKFYIYIE